MKLKNKIISIGAISVILPILTAISCGNAATGKGHSHSQNSEFVPKGFHAEKVPHGDHFHIVYIPDGSTWKDIYGTKFDADAVKDFPNHKIPDNAFVNMKMGEIKELSKITTIGRNAFSHADLSMFDGITKVTNEETGKEEVAPSLYELLMNHVTTIEEGAFNHAKLPKGFNIEEARKKYGNKTFVDATIKK